MTSFVGAPIRIRDEVFGNLYLAERLGEKEFSESDEAMLVALAGAAGFAIENARLYERSQQQRRWAQAIGELTQSLLESPDEDTALMLLAQQVVHLTEAQVCLVALRDEDGAPTRVRALHRRDGDARAACMGEVAPAGDAGNSGPRFSGRTNPSCWFPGRRATRPDAYRQIWRSWPGFRQPGQRPFCPCRPVPV